uniref:Uncharacterized protein n=1 Tax=Astyanax mexicanus TaxID=7994 RepID=A0A8B9LI84_ASTMX
MIQTLDQQNRNSPETISYPQSSENWFMNGDLRMILTVSLNLDWFKALHKTLSLSTFYTNTQYLCRIFWVRHNKMLYLVCLFVFISNIPQFGSP